MARSGKVRVDIDADASGVRRGVDDAERSLRRLNSTGRKAMKGLQVAGIATGAALGAGLAAAVVTGTQELIEQEKAAAQTAAAIKSTGGAANVTQKQIEHMAGSLQAATGLADDQIQSMENLLLTFTNIRNVGPDKIFQQATRASLDLSVAFGKDLNTSALMVGKALNDPLKGITALGRAGVQFTAQQKEQIKTLVESNRSLDAQKLILNELNKQVGGSAQAFGNTTAGQIERVKRAWEDVSEELMASFLPLITRVARGVLNNMDKVETFFNGLKVFVTGVVDFLSALFRGDWEKAWKIASTGAGRALNGILQILRKLVPKLYPIAVDAGRTIGRGILDGLDALIRSTAGGDALARFLGLGASGTVNLSGNAGRDLTGLGQPPAVGRPRAGGGFTEGQYRGIDDRLVPLAGNEAVLNPRQQAMVPGGRGTLMDIFRRTGAVSGGGMYAGGGFVNPVPGGSWKYGPGGGTHSRSENGYVWQDDDAWDIMGSDGMPVYAAFSGSIGRVSGFNSDARYWGHGLYLQGGPGQLFYKHLKNVNVRSGQSVTAGQLLGHLGTGVNGGPHLHLGASPIGLLSSARSGGQPGGVDDEGRSTKEERQPLLTRKQIAKITRVSPGSIGGSASAPGDRSSASIDARHRDDSLQDKQVRAATLSDPAKVGGITNPDKLAAIGDKAVAEERLNEINQDKADVVRDANAVRRTIVKLRGRLKSLYRQLRKARTRKLQETKREQINTTREQISEAIDDLKGLIKQAADLQADADELGYDIGQLSSQIAVLSDAEPAAAADIATDTATTDTGPTPDQQAVIDQANARALNAERSNAVGASFMRTLFGSGTIDPAGGFTTVNINTLHPGDPAIQGEVARWVVGALGGQGSVPTTSYPVA